MDSKRRRPLPIGTSDFKKLRDAGCVYVDKSLLIQEVMERGGEAALFIRPRRFGKTLNLSMLYYFFAIAEEDSEYLFHDLLIWKEKDYRHLQGKFPVIFLSLKDVKFHSLERTLQEFRVVLSKLYEQHAYLLTGNVLQEKEKALYRQICEQKGGLDVWEASLQNLSEWMARYYKKKVILLVDEYDAPMRTAYTYHFYEQLMETFRAWMSKSFKDNPWMERAVLTGILRVAKESMFSGANNIKVYSFVNDLFSEQFGLLHDEVQDLLAEFGLSGKSKDIEQWYDGYRSGDSVGIYNPWSVLNCINENGKFFPHWANSGDIELIHHLVLTGSEEIKMDLELLLQQGWVEKIIQEGVTFSTLNRDSHALWSLLLYSGYVALASEPSYDRPSRLRIPNYEVMTIFRRMIEDWFYTSIQERKYRQLLQSLTQGDISSFSQIFREFLATSASVFDISIEESEKIYHVFVLGMLIGLQDTYEIRSNRESGYGRYDVMLIPRTKQQLGIILEFKRVYVEDRCTLEEAAQAALQQIEEKEYARELHDRGIEKIVCLGLAFQGKKVEIQHRYLEK